MVTELCKKYNWGGWWNWDSLEFYLVMVIILYIILIHNNIKLKKKLNFNVTIFIILFYYYTWCNKSGLNISIHKFILSSFINYYYYIYLYKILIIIIFNKFKIIFYL